jgi:SnoaL-like protein
MSPDEQVVQTLYESFKSGDAAGMAECYRDDAEFRDLAFDLKGKQNIADMWRFVCHRRPHIWFGCIRTEGSEVKAHWVADYKFKGVNQVNYGINARFTCQEGKIVAHHDEASRWCWSKQALGFPKDVIVTLFPSVLRKQALEELKAFLEAEKTGKAG